MLKPNDARKAFDVMFESFEDQALVKSIVTYLTTPSFIDMKDSTIFNWILGLLRTLETGELVVDNVLPLLKLKIRELMSEYRGIYAEWEYNYRSNDSLRSVNSMLTHLQTISTDHFYNWQEPLWQFSILAGYKMFVEWLFTTYPETVIRRGNVTYSHALRIVEILEDIARKAVPMGIHMWAYPEFEKLRQEMEEESAEDEG